MAGSTAKGWLYAEPDDQLTEFPAVSQTNANKLESDVFAMQRGAVAITVANGSNGGEETITFPTPFLSTPQIFPVVRVTGQGDADTFFYASAGPVTATTATLVVTHRTQPLGADTTINVHWLAVA